MEVITPVLAHLAALGLTGTVAAAVAYWLFRILAEGWLESRFQHDLEAFRAANTREAERLKADLGRYADRATKFHAREYEVLPEAWGLMNQAYGATQDAISPLQLYPDLNAMTEPQLGAWLDGSGLPDFQKDEIQESGDKNSKYSRILTWKKIRVADKSCIEFINYIILQGVFIEEEIAKKMSDAGRRMRKALISREMAEPIGSNTMPGQINFWKQAQEEIQPVEAMVEEIKVAVRHRLFDIRLSGDSL